MPVQCSVYLPAVSCPWGQSVPPSFLWPPMTLYPVEKCPTPPPLHHVPPPPPLERFISYTLKQWIQVPLFECFKNLILTNINMYKTCKYYVVWREEGHLTPKKSVPRDRYTRVHCLRRRDTQRIDLSAKAHHD